MSTRLWTLVALGFFLPGVSWSEEASKIALKSERHAAEVEIDSGKKSVVVHLRPATDTHPSHVELTLFDRNRKPYTLELKALSPANAGVSKYGTSFRFEPSTAGIELRIPLTKGGKDVLRGK